MATDPPLMELRNVTRRYGAQVALRDVTLSVRSGRIGLLGPNGAGKSTLLKIVMGLLPPSSGQAWLLGRAIRKSDVSLRRLVGYMSETDALIPGLGGAEYVALAGELCGMPAREAHRRAHEVLTYLGLEEARYRRLEEYSTGMKQRLKLAQALIHDPPLLLLDEPTSGLDPTGRESMLRLLKTLAEEHGKSFLLSTHVLPDVERVCDTVIILHQGRVIRQGQTRLLCQTRQDQFRLRIVGRVDAFVDGLRKNGVHIGWDNGRTACGESTAEMTVVLPTGWTTNRLFRMAQERGVVIHGLQRDNEDLNQLFRRTIAESEHR